MKKGYEGKDVSPEGLLNRKNTVLWFSRHNRIQAHPSVMVRICGQFCPSDSMANFIVNRVPPAGLSHRLKPARRAALAVEKVTAGRLLFCGQDG